MFGTLRKKLLEAVDDYFGIVNAKGEIVLCSDQSTEGSSVEDFNNQDFRSNGTVVKGDLIFSRISSVYSDKYYVFIKKTSGETHKVLRLLALYAEIHMKQQMEKNNKFYFYKKLLQNKLSVDEVQNNATVYKIKTEARRAVLIIRHGESDYPVSDMIKNIFPDEKKNIVVDMEPNTVSYVIELKKNEDVSTLKKYCGKIVDTIEEELMVSVTAGIGNIVGNLPQAAVSYFNASMAMSVGSIFEFETNIFDFNTLGIGKLIYNSDKKVLEEFLRESVSRKTFELLDDEIIKTVRSFFKNNLNISETARQMYLHRNTLVYRIEKILKLTGLDLRVFDDAVSFKAAYMVKCYIDKLNQDQ